MRAALFMSCVFLAKAINPVEISKVATGIAVFWVIFMGMDFFEWFKKLDK